MNGQGKFVGHNDQGLVTVKYSGEFKDNLYHGQGHLVLDEGMNYQGAFIEGKRHGKGVLRIIDLNSDQPDDQDLVFMYEGDFEYDMM